MEVSFSRNDHFYLSDKYPGAQFGPMRYPLGDWTPLWKKQPCANLILWDRFEWRSIIQLIIRSWISSLDTVCSTIPWSIKSKVLRWSDKTVSTVELFPYVHMDQWYSILISAIFVEDPGVTQYWLSSIRPKKAGLRKSFTTNSSATLDTEGVREIGLKSFLISYK